MAASDARPVPRKNEAWRMSFAIRKSDGTLITTWTGADTEVSLDGAAYSDATNEATEIGTSGTGYIDFTAAEMNADCVLIKITVTNTGALPIVIPVYPEEAGDYRVADSQKVDLNTIKTQTVTASAGVTIPSSIASPTNITAATGVVLSGVTHTGAVIPTVSTVSNGVTVTTNNDKTGYALATTPPTAGAIADAVWDEARSGHTTAGTFGFYLDAAISGVSGGGGGGGDATLAKQEEILTAIDNYISTVVAGMELDATTIVGFPTTLNIGDSYTDDMSADIHIFLRDSNDDPITSVGTHDVTDPDFAPELTIAQDGQVGRVKATVTWVTASPEGYLKVEIPSSQSRRAAPGVAQMQLVLKWDGAEKAQTKQAVTWVARV